MYKTVTTEETAKGVKYFCTDQNIVFMVVEEGENYAQKHTLCDVDGDGLFDEVGDACNFLGFMYQDSKPTEHEINEWHKK